jgi:hypothetical protein
MRAIAYKYPLPIMVIMHHVEALTKAKVNCLAIAALVYTLTAKLGRNSELMVASLPATPVIV